jgi:hypothetical protein
MWFKAGKNRREIKHDFLLLYYKIRTLYIKKSHEKIIYYEEVWIVESVYLLESCTTNYCYKTFYKKNINKSTLYSLLIYLSVEENKI